jgi:hypothetical protein
LVLAFASKSLRKLCETEEHAEKHLDPIVAANLKRRLADLEAASSVQDLIAGRPRKSKVSEKFMMNLSDAICLHVGPNHPENPVDKHGKVDWSKVNRIKILSIGKCDD